MAEDKTNRRKQLDAQIDGTSVSVAPEKKAAPVAKQEMDPDVKRILDADRKKREENSITGKVKKFLGLKNGGLVTRGTRKSMGKAC